jgi:hypothetical protein
LGGELFGLEDELFEVGEVGGKFDGGCGGKVHFALLMHPTGVGGGVGLRGAFEGVGDEAVEEAADDAKAGLGGGEADAEVGVFGFAGFGPELGGFFELVAEAISRDLAGEVRFLLFGDVGLRRENLGEPLNDAADDLADARLGDFVLGGLGVGGSAGDVDGFVDLEVAFGGREGRCHWSIVRCQ